MKTILIQSRLLIILIVAVLLFAAAGTSYYFYNQYKIAQAALKNPDERSRMELAGVIEKVAKLTELPQGESPILATVDDVSKLNNQEFFKNAINGDKVLIYSNAKKAYLYRPSTNKIIEIGPINESLASANEASGAAQVAGESAAAKPSPTPSTVSLALFNGTKSSGLANKTEKELKSDFPEIKVLIKSNAKNDYEKTVVVVLEDQAKAQASEIAKKLNAEIKDKTPDGEYPPAGADIIIFLGTDRT